MFLGFQVLMYKDARTTGRKITRWHPLNMPPVVIGNNAGDTKYETEKQIFCSTSSISWVCRTAAWTTITTRQHWLYLLHLHSTI